MESTVCKIILYIIQPYCPHIDPKKATRLIGKYSEWVLLGDVSWCKFEPKTLWFYGEL